MSELRLQVGQMLAAVEGRWTNRRYPAFGCGVELESSGGYLVTTGRSRGLLGPTYI